MLWLFSVHNHNDLVCPESVFRGAFVLKLCLGSQLVSVFGLSLCRCNIITLIYFSYSRSFPSTAAFYGARVGVIFKHIGGQG